MKVLATRGDNETPSQPDRNSLPRNSGKGQGWQFSVKQAPKPHTGGLTGNRRTRFPPKRHPPPVSAQARPPPSSGRRIGATHSRASPARRATRIAPPREPWLQARPMGLPLCTSTSCTRRSPRSPPRIRSSPGSTARPTEPSPGNVPGHGPGPRPPWLSPRLPPPGHDGLRAWLTHAAIADSRRRPPAPRPCFSGLPKASGGHAPGGGHAGKKQPTGNLRPNLKTPKPRKVFLF